MRTGGLSLHRGSTSCAGQVASAYCNVQRPHTASPRVCLVGREQRSRQQLTSGKSCRLDAPFVAQHLAVSSYAPAMPPPSSCNDVGVQVSVTQEVSCGPSARLAPKRVRSCGRGAPRRSLLRMLQLAWH